jgi:hypothetical protein
MLTRTDLEQWFPDEPILTVPAQALPDGLSHHPTRQILSEVGMPQALLEVVEIDIDSSRGIRTMTEIYGRHDAISPDGAEDLYYLGFAGQPYLAVDGATGGVFQVDPGVRMLATSLEAFLRVLGLVSGRVGQFQRGELGEDDFADQLPTDALEYLEQIDVAALPAAEVAWRSLLTDVAANAA